MLTDKQFLKELIERGQTADEAYFHYAHIVACRLDRKLHEQLRQLINGPVWDGNVISKADRGELFELGLAIRVCHKGEQGFTGATYFAYSVLKLADEIKSGAIAA